MAGDVEGLKVDLDRLPPSSGEDNASREGAGAMWLALLAMLLVASGIAILGAPLAGVALWLGVRAQRRQHRTTGPALTAVVLGILGLLVGVGGPAGMLVLQAYGNRQMPALIAEHEQQLRAGLHQAAEDVFPCQGRIDGVELQSLYTQWPEFGGRPAITLVEADVAYVDVLVEGERYTVDMIGFATSGWVANGRMHLTRACEEAAGSHNATG